jgi:hypothetical protein
MQRRNGTDRDLPLSMTAIAPGVFRRGNETFEKWLRRGSKSFSLEIL